ncbi:MAG TPA: ABC transporter ATP-binding protein [Vicinamibacterales bacterium]|nr:ABC transporter ATP-binding protein [Vicinamibacterales bacterium]
MSSSSTPLVRLRDVSRRYGSGESGVDALRNVSLDIERGAFAAIVGPSGCGKSTLLHLCGGMDRPTSGEVTLDGDRLDPMDEERLARVRRERIGFVFQSFNLLPTLTTAENIALPLLLAGVGLDEAGRRAAALAERVGVQHRMRQYPAQLSGGEAQRAAVARAVIHGPQLIIADEPTGSLDSANGARVLALLRELNREAGITVLLATHAADLAAAADLVVHLRDGRIEQMERQTSAG